MYALLIKFPFSSINDEKYELSLYSASTSQAVFSNALSYVASDRRSFKFVSTRTVGQVVVTTYEGTLVGDVTSEDDGRDDVFAPLVASKLKFNMMCQEFPTWLMDLCNYYTNVKAVLTVKRGTNTVERWRGYLMANTLNMTVVNELMSCPLVAVDEVGIAKYLKFRENYTSSNASPTLLELFDYYWNSHVTSDAGNSRFDNLYSILGVTMRNNLFLSRDMRLKDGGGNDVFDLLSLTINLERYFLDREACWGNVFEDLCEYLGLSFCVGSMDAGGNDCYLLAGPDYNLLEHITYTFGSSSCVKSPWRGYHDFTNQEKVGADFQVSYKPDEWKGVSVKSTPERPPVHEYLGKDNVKAIQPSTGHGEWCETRIGKKRTSPSQTIDDYEYRVFQYADIVDKEDQWIPENKYVTMEDCKLASDARFVGLGDGYFPMTDSSLGRLRPSGEDTDSMDFALSKWGMIAAKIGTYDTLRQKISPDLKNYFVVLNNKWGRLFWDGDRVPTIVDPDAQLIGTFTPFADDKSIRPNNHSYLSIDFTALFLNENIGYDIGIVENGSVDDDLKGKIQAVFPITNSFYDWQAEPEPEHPDASWYTGNLTATSHNIVYSFFPYVVARLSIGNYYWNGSSWEHHDGSTGLPTFNLPLIPESVEKYWEVATGYPHKDVLNYYYVACHPKMGASENVFRVPLDGLSVADKPLSGKVKLEIFGRIPFFNAWKSGALDDTHYNNILFMLMSDIKVEYTDEAYYADKDIKVVAKVETDPGSTTKKIKEVELSLSTPPVDGVFENCLLYNDGNNWVNLQSVHRIGGEDSTPEELKAVEMASVLSGKHEFCEFSRRFSGYDTSNIYNVGFTVRGLTECLGIYLPVTRKFNWTMETVRWKLQHVANGGRSYNISFDDSYNV